MLSYEEKKNYLMTKVLSKIQHPSHSALCPEITDAVLFLKDDILLKLDDNKKLKTANPNVLAIWLQGILYTLPSLKTERLFNPVADEDILPFQKEIVQNLLIQPIFLNSMMKIPREIYFLNKFLNLNTYMDIIIPQDGTLDLHSRIPMEFHKRPEASPFHKKDAASLIAEKLRYLYPTTTNKTISNEAWSSVISLDIFDHTVVLLG